MLMGPNTRKDAHIKYLYINQHCRHFILFAHSKLCFHLSFVSFNHLIPLSSFRRLPKKKASSPMAIDVNNKSQPFLFVYISAVCRRGQVVYSAGLALLCTFTREPEF